MKLSIIIVSWNTQDLTLKCVKSIFKYVKGMDYEIFLIDNNSTDRTIELIYELNISNLKLIKNKENLGFAAANNQAIKQAKGEYILLLNSDTELICHSEESERSEGDEESLKCKKRENLGVKGSFANAQDDKSGLEKMINFMDSHPEIGIVGPKLLNTDGSLQRSCRQFPKLLDQLFIQLKFYNFWPDKIKSVREYFMLDFKHAEIREVDQVMGAAILVRREVFDKIGLLDEKFWAIFEEVDFCKRAKDAGYKIYFYPITQIVHHKEQSFKKMDILKKQTNFNQSLYHYFYKHKPFWQLFILWLIQPINLFLTWLDSLVGIRKRAGKRKDL